MIGIQETHIKSCGVIDYMMESESEVKDRWRNDVVWSGWKKKQGKGVHF